MTLQAYPFVDGELLFDAEFLSAQQADQLLAELLQQAQWQQQKISISAKYHVSLEIVLLETRMVVGLNMSA